MRFVLAFLLALVAGPCFAQVNPGTTPLSIAKGGTAGGTAAAAWANLVQPPSASTLGGIKSLTCSASNWFNTLSTAGALGCAQPNFTDLAGSLGLGQIPASLITYAKIQNVTAARLLGNPSGGAAAPSEISLGATFSFSGSALQTAAHTGDVTTAVNSFATTIAANAVTNAKLATMGAYTFKCNNTGSSASPTDCDATAFTAKPSPVSADIVLIQDSAASNAYKKTTVGALASAGTVSDVNGLTGSVVVPIQPGGRLTLTSGTPAPTADVVAATLIYYAPMNGSYVPIYNGTNVRQYQFTANDADTVGLSVTLGSAWGATTNFDWFVTLNGGVPVLCSNAWTSDIARTVGLALFRGMQTNATTMTTACRINNTTQITVAANQGTYIGTSRTVAAGQMDDQCAKRYVWNAYNQVMRNLCQVTETADNWNYTSATVQQAGTGTGNTANQLDVVIGLTGNMLQADLTALASSSVGNIFMIVGIGIDSTTVNSATVMSPATLITVNDKRQFNARLQTFPAIGRHFYPWQNSSTASGVTTWYGDNGQPGSTQSGLTGFTLM